MKELAKKGKISLNSILFKIDVMFLTLNHQKLNVYIAARGFVLECYRFSKFLPQDERFNMIQQIRRAALSVHLNIAEGSSRKSEAERKRYSEIARGSIIEIDAALDICEALEYCKKENLKSLGDSMQNVFAMLSKMIKTEHSAK